MTATVPQPASVAERALAGVRPAARLLVNPRARRLGADAADRLARALDRAYEVEVTVTGDRGHATELAREAVAAGAEVVVVAGGDGTVSEAARGVAGSGVPLACLPAGCTDVFARAIGVPRDPLAAADRLARGALTETSVDLGTVDGRPFLSTAGVGFSASMTAAADAAPQRKARFGQLAFAGAATAELAGRYLRRPPQMWVEAGGRRTRGVTAVVQNSHVLTYFGARAIRVCGAAGLEAGAISLAVLERSAPLDVAGVLARLVSGDVLAHRRIEGFAGVSDAVIASADGRALPVEADGEYLGERERIHFSVLPGALRVLR